MTVLGDTGKKLHTGRSRNDQVALDMRLYTRQEVMATDALLEELLNVLLRIMEENTETIMPGFTHLQKAQPITLAHHMGAYFEMFKRDRQRLRDIFERMNYCPLGSGASSRYHLSSGSGLYGRTAGILRTNLKQYGWRVRQGLSDRVFISTVYDYDASEPF